MAMPVAATTKTELQGAISQHVQPGATVCTDEHPSYEGLQQVGFTHGSVNPSAGEYVGANDIHVNSTELMWALFRRSLFGTWHYCSLKYLARYLKEATFRLNQGNVKHHTLDRMGALATRAFCHRITYRELTRAMT